MFRFFLGCGSTEGNFFTLSEAYDNGWLTKENLQNISFYHSGKGIAVGITDNYNSYDLLIIPEYKIGDITFYNFALSDIRIWRGKK